MKKLSVYVFILLLLFTVTLTPIYATDEVRIISNGQVLKFDVPPQIVNGRTLVPMRKFFEEIFGANVSWDGKAKKVTADFGGVTIEMTIGEPVIYIDGQPKTTDVPAQIISGRTMIPLRVISETMGIGVGWDEKRRVVVVGLAVDPDNKTNTSAIDAQQYTDTPLDELGDNDYYIFQMYDGGKVYAKNFYTVPGIGKNEGWTELKYSDKYEKSFRIFYKGDPSAYSVKSEDVRNLDPNEIIRWSYKGKTYVNTRSECYEFFGSTINLQTSYGRLNAPLSPEWFSSTFGHVYDEWFDRLVVGQDAGTLVQLYFNYQKGYNP